ncbi:MAG: hypothetical protein ABGX04_13340 [Myxococcales bacterium]|nr:hypothetical protein [Myxococcales bacterium]HIK85548.1 hypothetical protein [Myxococcales bacterium]
MRWFRAHKVLLAIYIGGLTLAVLELYLPQFQHDYLTNSKSLLQPEINLADVSSRLYPDRAYSFYYRALQAALCVRGTASPPECRNRAPVKSHEIRELVERSLATGNRSIEMAMYNYAIILLQEQASHEEIDAAIHNWRTNYPNSNEVDPREMHRQMTQGTIAARPEDRFHAEKVAR